MDLIVYFGAFCVAIAVPVAWWSVSSTAPTATARAHLEAQNTTNLRTISLARTAGDRLWRPAVGTVAARLRRLTPAGVVERLDTRSQLAGVSAKWPVDRILSAKFLLLAIGLLIGGLSLIGDPSPRAVLGAIVFPVIGYILPDTLITRLAAARQDEITRQLPDAMDQVTITVEAGLGLEAALARVAERAEGPLPEELGRMIQDIAVGIPRQEALDRLVERTDVADLRQFVASLRQAEKNGVPLAHVLRTHADELRERRRQRAEEKAHALPVKIAFPLLVCILPALFVIIMGPAIVELSKSALFQG